MFAERTSGTRWTGFGPTRRYTSRVACPVRSVRRYRWPRHYLLTSVRDPWYFDADPDPRIRTSDYWIRVRIQLLSSETLRILKNQFFNSYFFLITYHPQAHYLQSKNKNNKKLLQKFCVKILFCKHYFRKRKEPDPDPYHWLIRVLEAQKHPALDPRHCFDQRFSHLFLCDTGTVFSEIRFFQKT